MGHQSPWWCLQGQVFPSSTLVKLVSYGVFSIDIKMFVWCNHNKQGSVFGPNLVWFCQHTKKPVPVMSVPFGIDKPPWLVVVGRGGSSGGLKKGHYVSIIQLLTCHWPWGPSVENKRIYWKGWLSSSFLGWFWVFCVYGFVHRYWHMENGPVLYLKLCKHRLNYMVFVKYTSQSDLSDRLLIFLMFSSRKPLWFSVTSSFLMSYLLL